MALHRDREGKDGAATGPVLPNDPELSDDLGAEFEFRGDVVEAELEQARAEVDELRDRVLRTQAEFDNFRKRTTREREEERKRAAERVIGEMLPVIDNMERAIEHAKAGWDVAQLLQGIESISTQMLGVLGKEGAKVIDPTGQPFDPTQHQAMSQTENPDVPDGTVLEVYQKGYTLGGRVLRPAMVVVSTGGPAREE
ncbi:MAG: nucleotide exchange factor GrpE [Coriobacteriia bacterium]